MSETPESAPVAWEEKEMRDVSRTERSPLTEPPGAVAADAWKPRVVTSTGLALATGLFLLVARYSFREGPSLFSFHPVTMTIGWMVCMPLAIDALRAGALTSRLPLAPRTRHWMIQGAAAVFITGGFAVIVANKIRLGKDHFTTLHGVFGLVSVIFMCLILSGGVAALYSIRLKDYLPPVYTKLVHGFAGILALSVGTITIVLGLFSKVVTEEWAKYVGSALAVLVTVLTVLRPAIGMYVRLKERLSYVR